MPTEYELDYTRFAARRDLVQFTLPFLREVGRRSRHPLYTYRPDHHAERNQLGFHKSTAGVRLVYGGNQSGKSYSVAMEVSFWLTGRHPHQPVPQSARVYAISSSYRTLQEGIWRHLKSMIPEWMIEKVGPTIAGWSVPYYLRMKSGAQIDFISGEGREDARRKIQAAELDIAVIDEEVDELLWTELLPRRLVRGGRIVICATLVRSEPWTMQLEDRAESGDPDVHLTRLSTYAAAKAGHVKRSIIKEMEAHLTDDEKEVRLLGKSRKSEGIVYPEFCGANVIAPIELPKDWTRFIAIDPGWRTAGVVWAAVAPDDKVYIYNELYLHTKTYKNLANAVFAANGYKLDPPTGNWVWDNNTGQHIEAVWIDPSAFGHHESGEFKTGNLLCQYGLQCAPSQNDVEAGIQLVRQALMSGMDGIPRLRIFRTCENLLREIRQYRRHKESRDQNRNQRTDAPIKRNDHLLDPLRYLFLQGLYYRKQVDPWLLRDQRFAMEGMPHINVAPGMQKVLEENWKQLMGSKTETSTKIGLGSEV